MMGTPRHAVRFLLMLLIAAAGFSCRTIDASFAYGTIRKSMRVPAQSPPGRLDVQDGITIVHVYGTPAEMGRQYGTLLREPLRALSRVVHGTVPWAMKDRLLKYAADHERYLPPAIREEIAAMSESSGVSYVELVALNIIPKLSCSTLAVWDDRAPADSPAGRHLIMGRNSDYFSMGLSDRGMLVVVHHPRPEDGLATVSVTFLGMVGSFTGINSDGVAFGNMLVFNAAGPQQDDSGLTVQLAMRLAAQQSRNAAEMAAAMQSQAHAIPMNVMVADPREAIVLELGLANQQLRRGEDGVLVSSNHFLSPKLAAEEKSCERYDSLLAAGRAHRPAMTPDQMKPALHDARIRGLNLQAVIFEPHAMRMHVSINKVPASGGPYTEIDLRALFATPAIAAK